MKRYISLVLVAVVLVGLLAVPSYAAENQFINVLDICTPDDCGSNMPYVTAGVPVNFSIPSSEIGYIDFVVRLRNPENPSCYLDTWKGNISLNKVKIDDYTYRFYGTPTFNTSNIKVVLYGMFSSDRVQFLSFKISASPFNSMNCPVTGFFSYGSGEEVPFYYNSSDDYSGAILHGNSSFNYQDFRGYLQFPDWKKYDYISFQFYASHLSILSFAASLAELSVPYEVTYLSSDSSYGVYFVNVTLDLTEVDRNTSLDLEFIITGNVPSLDSLVGSFSVLSCNGLLFNSGISDSLSIWYRIKSFFTDNFASLHTWIDSHTSSITGAISEWGQNIVDAIVGDDTQNEVISDAVHTQEDVNEQINVQLGSAISDWDGNITVVSGGYDSAVLSAVPALDFLSNLAQGVFSGMGWFGTMFFFIGFVNVFFLFMNKTGLGSRKLSFGSSSNSSGTSNTDIGFPR